MSSNLCLNRIKIVIIVIEIIIAILLAAVAYFVYGGISGSLAVIILMILSDLAAIACFIPVVGVGIQWYIMSNWIFPWTFGLTGITATWITSLIFWGCLASGTITTIWVSAAFIRKALSR